MQLIELTESDKSRYNEFVATHQRDAFLQSWEWGDWQIKLGKRVKRYALIDHEQIVASAQLIQLPPNRSPIWYAPRGPVFTTPSLKMLDQIVTQLKTKLPGTLGIRVEPEQTVDGLAKVAKRTMPSQPERTAMINLSVDTEELLKKMHEKTRYNIRLAEKKGVQVASIPAHDLTHAQIASCINLLQTTAQRQKFRNHTTQYLQTFLRYFSELPKNSSFQVWVYFARYQSTTLTAAILIDFGQTRIYLFGGSSDKHRNVMAPYLLHWRAITEAKEKGLTFYDLGGSETVGGKEGGFTRFKSGFNGTEVNYPGTWDIPLKPLLYPLYALSRKLNRLRNKMM
jgi:lipid II:glycine glycyltransferase (peptidoglycan interpeptide bridge formation enzyme)